MCTYITHRADVAGSAKGPNGWFTLTQANVGFDHPVHAPLDHAFLLDFANPSLGLDARVGVEMDLASAKVLVLRLQQAIEEAEASGVAE
jgi:hypothetical protein